MAVLLRPSRKRLAILALLIRGSVASTLKAAVAGERSVAPRMSTARTLNECAPSATVARGCPEGHALKAAASTEHGKVEPVLVERKLKAGVASPDSEGGRETIVVSG